MIKCLFVFLMLATIQCDDDYYKALGLKKNATQKEIKKMFKKLSKKYHPDVSKESDAETKFREISEAYDVLVDEDKRRKYDRFGKKGLEETPSRRGFDPFNFFNGGDDSQPEEEVGEPLEVPLFVTLEDIYVGARLKILMTKKSVCSHCRGSGAENPDDLEKCDKCGGRGIYFKTQQVAPGFIQQIQTTCPKCGGKGTIIKNQCHVCHGQKLLDDLETYQIQVEKGIQIGEKIIHANAARDYVDKSSSDLVFIVKEIQHAFYSRERDNLKAEIKISLKEALLGFEKKIKTLDNRFVVLKNEGVTQPFQKFFIKREGMPKHNYSSERGDLVITCKVEMPEDLNEEQLEYFKEFFEI